MCSGTGKIEMLLRQNFKTLQINQTLQKSAEIKFTIWIQLTSFWSMSCVFLCTLSSCKVYYFASLLKPLLRAWFFSGLYGLLIMSSISCCVFLCLFVLLYDIGIKFDMIWYDIWCVYIDLYPIAVFTSKVFELGPILQNFTKLGSSCAQMIASRLKIGWIN